MYDKTATKQALKRYVELRTCSPEIFANRDPLLEGVQFIYEIAYVFYIIFNVIYSKKSHLRFITQISFISKFSIYEYFLSIE